MPITNGTISILRRVRTGDFEHIEPHVTISFSVEPNEDAAQVADGVRMIVDAQYKNLLGIEPEKKTRAKVSAEKPGTGMEVIKLTPLPEAAPSTAGPVPPTATEPPPASVAPPSPPLLTVSTVAAPGAAFDAAGRPTVLVAPTPAATEPAPVAGPSTQTATAVAPPAPPAVPAAGPTEGAIAGISDETIGKKCQDKTDELNALYEPGVGLQKVVALIRQYISPPGRATQIPHENRQAFLTQLATLA